MPISPLAITAGAWAWDKYGKTVTDKAASVFKGRWEKFKWNAAAEKYRAKIKKLYGTMQIMGMAEPVPLEDIFTEAYMLDKPTAFGRFDIERLKQSSADPEAPPPNAKRIAGLTLVNKNRNLFILGKPGAGKTTFLKYIAVQAAEPKRPVIDKVPIFISLKQWADSDLELLAFMTERFDICKFPAAAPFIEELLESGNVIVLFDGLDEVNQESGQRDRQTRAMNNFIEKYDRTQCLVTCRIAASDYSFKPFTYVEIADFTEKQIEKFVANWFRREGEKDEETCKRFLTEFKREDNKGLRDLARTPLLLTLLCLAFNETLTFPQRRVEIYQEALDALLKKWDSSRRIKRDEVYRKLSLGHKENMLARIAAETFEKNQYFIPQAELEKFITDYVKNVPPHDTNEATDGETILKAIEAQHGIFVERAHRIYSFSHLTFQEYFTAKYIVANATKVTLTNLVKEQYADGRWREVFLLTTSMLSDANQFVKTFRRSIDELIKGDEKLKSILEWADKQSASIQADPWLVRPCYLSIEIDPERMGLYFDSPSDSLGILTNKWGYHFSLNHARILGLDVAIALTLAIHIGLTAARTLAHDAGLNELEEELSALLIPSRKVPVAEHQKFENTVRTLMRKHRNIGHEWNLTEAQKAMLADYIDATNLLRDCLGLAFMPPDEKQAMLNSLYLPPASDKDGQGV